MSNIEAQKRELLAQKLEILEQQNNIRVDLKNKRKTIYGIVDMDKKVIRKYQILGGQPVELNLKDDNEVDILIPEVLEPLIAKQKRYKIFIGGRSGGKTMTGAKIACGKAKDSKFDIAFFRQFQNSIEESMHKTIKDEVSKLEFTSYEVLKSSIENNVTKSKFVFRGLEKNTMSNKGMSGYNLFIIDEAQSVSEDAFKNLTPTLREENSEIWMFANPESSEDAFSKRYITPYIDQLERDGFYEDEDMYIVYCNYDSNPFFPESMEKERKIAKNALSTAEYEHIWLGKFNDSITDALIEPEWFDAAIDAHKIERFKEMFEPIGAVICTHDVSDTGADAKAFATRHGSIIKSIKDKRDGDINEGALWAIKEAILQGVDHFVYDGDGMGVGIRKTVGDAFSQKKVEVHEYKGSNSPDDKNLRYDNDSDNTRTNKDVFYNKRSQYMWRLRMRFYNTYCVVVKGLYIDPKECISIDSDGIGVTEKGRSLLPALRSEVCRQPLKNNSQGLIQMMPKTEMKKRGIKSPNMLDALAMTMFEPKTSMQNLFKKLNYRKGSIC
tara:strand:+ start:530 stop:2188 length:1659 start_codon:yes stop_codon:yes gene_type:complete